MSRTHPPLAAASLLFGTLFGALLGALLAAPAQASQTLLFHVDPARSWLRVQEDSALGVYLGPIGTVPVLPLLSQVGRLGGVTVLPQRGLPPPSDGRATRVRGTLFTIVNEDAGGAPVSISLAPYASLLVPLASGTWWPPEFEPLRPGDPPPPEPPTKPLPVPAQLAFALGSDVFGLHASVALRDAALQLRAFRPLTSLGDGRYGFGGIATAHLLGGALDVQAGATPATGRGALRKAGFYQGAISDGLLEDLGGDAGLQLTIPFAFEVELGADQLGGLPLTGSLGIEGRIVATTVPEPGAAGAGLAAAAALAGLARRRRGGAQ